MAVDKPKRRLRIRKGIRNKLSGTADKPRLCVFKSNTNIYAQIINDDLGHTMASVSSRDLDKPGQVNKDVSKKVGQKLGAAAMEKGITTVVFDRSGYLYHGRVKALAEGVREAGLKI